MKKNEDVEEKKMPNADKFEALVDYSGGFVYGNISVATEFNISKSYGIRGYKHCYHRRYYHYW